MNNKTPARSISTINYYEDPRPFPNSKVTPTATTSGG